jgi:hypothetical protein
LEKPTVGQIVHFYTRDGASQHNGQGAGPYPAIVTQVFGDDGMANLKVLPGFAPVRDEGLVQPKGKSDTRWWEPRARRWHNDRQTPPLCLLHKRLPHGGGRMGAGGAVVSAPLLPGHRQLGPDERDMIAVIRGAEFQVLHLLDALGAEGGAFEIDKRWVSIARTHIEQGFMAAVRAVAKPVPLQDKEAQALLAELHAKMAAKVEAQT